MNEAILDILNENLNFYRRSNSKDNLQFCLLLESLIKNINKMQPVIQNIASFASDYDLDEKTPGNGYRSFVSVCESAIKRIFNLCNELKENREKILFRKRFYEKELAAYSVLMDSLYAIVVSLIETHEKTVDRSDRSLYSEEGIYNNTIRKTMDSINLECFYGRALAFHMPPSFEMPMKIIATIMATYTEHYFSNDSNILKICRLPHTLVKYYFSEDLLSKQIVECFENVWIDFAQSLMNLSESKVFNVVQELTEAKICVNQIFEITSGPLLLDNSKSKGEFINIPVPNCHIGVKSINCRLMSSRLREGMKIQASSVSKSVAEPSKNLIIHVHGGGWITGSSKFHGSYTREWAAKLDIPILSIDYTLVPEASFPRAIDEIFYVYCWALKHPQSLGSTCENVIFIGDSAGGNLVAACVIKCIEMGIRKPEALFTVYGVFSVELAMLPSRYLGIMDVVLPYTFHMRALKSYNGFVRTRNQITENRKIPKSSIDEFATKLPNHYLASPHYAPNEILKQFPKCFLFSGNLDSCLDESVEFARKLKSLGVDVNLEILEGLSHGFLNFSQFLKRSHQGSMTVLRKLGETFAFCETL